MNVLTVCIGGRVRSVSVSNFLKGHYSADVIALGTATNSEQTFKMISDWADIIIPVEDRYNNTVPAKYKEKWESCVIWNYKDKVKVMDLGFDIWGNPMHKDLEQLVESRIKNVL